MDAQLKKGVLELCLLQLLSRGETYGYDLMRQMRLCFPEVGESTLYAILRRLNRNGMTELFSGKESGGPPRKYCRITAAGREQLKAQRAEWEDLAGRVRRVCSDE